MDEERFFGFGFGVALLSADGSRVVFRWVTEAEAGVRAKTVLGWGSGAEASDMGGEGGSCI
jgi:hypothetical protein